MMLSVTRREDPSTGKAVGVVGVGQNVTEFTKSQVRSEKLP